MLSKESVAAELRVGIAEWQVARAPKKLVALGLGSCVAIILYDPISKIGGLSHVMLPDSSQFKKNSNQGKYADTAVPLLLKEVLAQGGRKETIWAKIVGGAQMFFSADKNFSNSIGQRNVEKTLEVLDSLGIAVVAKDVGGNRGRTVVLETDDGTVWVRSLGMNTVALE